MPLELRIGGVFSQMDFFGSEGDRQTTPGTSDNTSGPGGVTEIATISPFVLHSTFTTEPKIMTVSTD
jgi:hypothetical protein